MLRVYGDSRSGNCHKLKLLLAQLEQDCDWHEVDVMSGATRTAEFRAMNPNGKIPLLRLEDGTWLAESNACLFYLAQNSPFWPQAATAQAQVMQWLFFEQYSHEPYIATLRFWKQFLDEDPQYADRYAWRREPGYRALEVMEEHLRTRAFFVNEQYSIADIGLFAYSHVAGEGGFELQRFPAIRAWLDRVAAQAGHIAMAPILSRAGHAP